MMFPIIGSRTEINVLQIVSAHEDKGGDEWVLRMTDDKQFTVSKGEYHAIRELLNMPGAGCVPGFPAGYQITLTGTAMPPTV